MIVDKMYITSYDHDNAPYTVQKNTSEVAKLLEEISKPLKLNPDKCHLSVPLYVIEISRPLMLVNLPLKLLKVKNY